jgi:putative flippase GtrA
MLLIRFILVGILNTIFGYSIWAILLFFGMHYALAVIVSTLFAILFNFKTTGYLVFKNKNNKLILRFALIYTATTVLNILLLKIAKILSINLYVAGLFITGIIAILSFLLQKYYVFKN